jgi:hypothetical protein
MSCGCVVVKAMVRGVYVPGAPALHIYHLHPVYPSLGLKTRIHSYLMMTKWYSEKLCKTMLN